MSDQENAPLLKACHPVTLTDAKEWTTNWRKWCLENGFTPDTTLKAFYIPIDDVKTLAESEKAGGVRAYFGLTDPTDPGSIKLVLVATEQNDLLGYGRDIIKPIPSKNDEDLYTIYDMTRPCPRYCDVDSSLFGDPIPPTSPK